MRPAKPSHVNPSTLLRDLAEQYQQAAVAVIFARAKGQPVDRGDVLAELAISTEIANRMRQSRCAAMRQALRAGATVEQVAAAVEANISDVGTQLTQWAAGQRREGLSSEAEVDEVMQLVE